MKKRLQKPKPPILKQEEEVIYLPRPREEPQSRIDSWRTAQICLAFLLRFPGSTSRALTHAASSDIARARKYLIREGLITHKIEPLWAKGGHRSQKYLYFLTDKGKEVAERFQARYKFVYINAGDGSSTYDGSISG